MTARSSTATPPVRISQRERRQAAERKLLDATVSILIERGYVATTTLEVQKQAGVSRGVIVCEGVWPPSAFLDGRGVNVLTGDDSVAPFGGAAFHDAHVWARRG